MKAVWSLPLLLSLLGLGCASPPNAVRPPSVATIPMLPVQENQARGALVLGGRLRLEDVVHVSRERQSVTASSEAMERVRKGNALLYAAVDSGHAVYGMNRGVGLNKDRVVFQGGAASARDASEEFNLNMLYAHSAGVGPALPEETVRAAMLVRAQTMLLGRSGVQEDIVRMLLAMLNHGIHPVVPSGGSVGEADITILPHIGLAMLGEGNVTVNGRKQPARDALAAAGLHPIRLRGKDALALLSSNAYSAGMGALVAYDIRQTLRAADLVVAMSLEGLNGNLAPFLEITQSLRPFPGQTQSAAHIRQLLEGSFLSRKDADRALQDPLSFRTVSHVHGAAFEAIERLWAQLEIQINTSDDNPAVVTDIAANQDALGHALGYGVETKSATGMLLPTASFEPIVWVLGFESLAIALNHVAYGSCHRTIHLDSAESTKLSRFLAPDAIAQGYGILQNTITALCAEVRNLSNPVSADFIAVAGGIEDHASNAPLAVRRVADINRDLRNILGIELMHAAQAIDLRRRKSPDLALGRGSRAAYAAYRAQVPFMEHDRELTPDIQRSYDFLGTPLARIVDAALPIAKDR